MSLTLSISGPSSTLSTNFFPPIQLNENSEYAMGLVLFQTFYSVPNVDETNNKFCIFLDPNQNEYQEYIIPIGSYEIDDLNEYLKAHLPDGNTFELRPNNNTLKCEISYSKAINFKVENSLGTLLGFNKRILLPNLRHESDSPVSILKVNVLRVECNITTGSYVNGELIHTIHEFFPTVPPGYKIVEVPNNVIYLPINTTTIDNVTVRIVDQNGQLVNFRGEEVTVRLHIKKL